MATGLENLAICQLAKALELDVYVITKQFPKDEKYRSVDQLRRSSSSVTNNIAECYYKQSMKERIHILKDTVICEAEETRSNLRLCGEKNFSDKTSVSDLINRYTEFMKMTHGYIRFLKNQLTKKPTN